MLRGLFSPVEPEVRAQATTWGVWPGESSGMAPVVNQSSALQLMAVLGCVQLITDSISTLPIDTYRENGNVREESPTPAWLKKPTVDMDWTAFCTQVVSSLVLHGNSYVVVLRSPGTRAIVELIPQDPSLISVVRTNGRKVFMVGGREFNGEILHIPGLMLPGSDVGLSPLEYARQSVGLGLQAQEFASDQFGSSLNMPGVIEIPGKANPDSMGAMAQAWRKARGKRGRGLPGVLEGGATWKPTGVTNEQAQFLESRKWSAAEICAQLFLIDPRELGIPLSGSTLDYTNGETRRSELLTKGLLRWMIRVEKGISSLLPNPQYMKFNVDGFLRGDSAARWGVYEIASRINTAAVAIGMDPVLDTAEMRDYEDLNPIDFTPPAPAPAPVPVAPQMNSATPVNVSVIHNDAEQRADAPVVNVTNDVHVPEQRTEAPVVHVHQEPTVVTVPATEVRINMPETETRTTVRTVERDEHGRITRVIDEVG